MMPDALTQEQILEMFEDATPLILNNKTEDVYFAKKECEEYLEGKNQNVSSMLPLSVYYIISQLPSSEQIKFINEHIDYIKKHNDDIFLYNMIYPKSLSYYLSLDVLNEIAKLDKDIFEKIVNGNFENLTNGFSHQDFMAFYTKHYDVLNKQNNIHFVNNLHCHWRLCWQNLTQDEITFGNHSNVIDFDWDVDYEFIVFILEQYRDKIKTFKSCEMLRLLTHIESVRLNTSINIQGKEAYLSLLMHKQMIEENKEQLDNCFACASNYELEDFFYSVCGKTQKLYVSTFYESIIKSHDIKGFVGALHPDITYDLYHHNKELFSDMTLTNWVTMCCQRGEFNEQYKEIIDTFKIEDIKGLFQFNIWCTNYSALEYVEQKYREELELGEDIKQANGTSEIFSENYFKDLKKLKYLLNHKLITREDEKYRMCFQKVLDYFKDKHIIKEENEYSVKEAEKLFFKIVRGLSITILYSISSIEQIASFNRTGAFFYGVSSFTIEQLGKYNVKEHNKLCKLFSDYYFSKASILKLMFVVGYHHTRAILKLNHDYSVLEHLTENINMKEISLDKDGNPILNHEILNLLFPDKTYSRIKEMLEDKNDLYTYFPRIFSEWEAIKSNVKKISLSAVVDFLKSHDVSVSPKYYRLDGKFKFIGCKDDLVKETLSLHNEILKRYASTIPRISGVCGEYSYEVLRLHDMNSLTVGNKTDCCFTVLGNGYSCLKHSVTSENGRILVIKKNGELLAQSWIWRNGDLLCLDNIEIQKKEAAVDFLDVYLDFADKLIQKSFEYEGDCNCIKNVTIGYTDFDKPIIGIKNYPFLIAKECKLDNYNKKDRLGNNKIVLDKLPAPIEEVEYLDSKNVQCLIKGSRNFNLFQSEYLYQDERKDVFYYHSDINQEENDLEIMNQRINALRYVKLEEENHLELFSYLDVSDLKEAYCNEDWYYIVYQNGEVESYIHSFDPRAQIELSKTDTKTCDMELEKRKVLTYSLTS